MSAHSRTKQERDERGYGTDDAFDPARATATFPGIGFLGRRVLERAFLDLLDPVPVMATFRFQSLKEDGPLEWVFFLFGGSGSFRYAF